MKKSYLITAIDTDAGKSIVTGLLARWLMERGVRVITQKMAQTGCAEVSEDIETHRRIMDTPFFPEDHEGLTCPYLFPFPASPHLSARLAETEINPEKIQEATLLLASRYDCVLTEGVGGVMVPLTEDVTVLDYMKRFPQPAILVAHARLGSINHTLLSLEALSNHGIELAGVVYNRFAETDPLITEDSMRTLRNYLTRYYPQSAFVELLPWKSGDPTPDFSALLR